MDNATAGGKSNRTCQRLHGLFFGGTKKAALAGLASHLGDKLDED